MNRFLFCTLLLLPAGIPAEAHNHDPVKSETRTVSAFHSIQADGVFIIDVTKGDQPSVVVEAPADLLEQITTDVSNGNLLIGQNGCIKNLEDALKIHIITATLDDIDLSDLAQLKTSSAFTVSKLHVKLDGGSVAEITIQADEAELEASGTSSLEHTGISGSPVSKKLVASSSGGAVLKTTLDANVLELGASGTSQLIHHRLGNDELAESLDIDVSGGADLSVERAAKRTNIEASGTSSVKASGGSVTGDRFTYRASGGTTLTADVRTALLTLDMSGTTSANVSGTADSEKVFISGGATVSGRKLETVKCCVNATGTSEAHVYVKDMLTAEAEGGASIVYHGHPGKKTLIINQSADIQEAKE